MSDFLTSCTPSPAVGSDMGRRSRDVPQYRREYRLSGAAGLHARRGCGSPLEPMPRNPRGYLFAGCSQGTTPRTRHMAGQRITPASPAAVTSRPRPIPERSEIHHAQSPLCGDSATRDTRRPHWRPRWRSAPGPSRLGHKPGSPSAAKSGATPSPTHSAMPSPDYTDPLVCRGRRASRSTDREARSLAGRADNEGVDDEPHLVLMIGARPESSLIWTKVQPLLLRHGLTVCTIDRPGYSSRRWGLRVPGR